MDALDEGVDLEKLNRVSRLVSFDAGIFGFYFYDVRFKHVHAAFSVAGVSG